MGGFLNGGILDWGDFGLGGFCLGGFCPRGVLSRGVLSGRFSTGGILSCHRLGSQSFMTFEEYVLLTSCFRGYDVLPTILLTFCFQCSEI